MQKLVHLVIDTGLRCLAGADAHPSFFFNIENAPTIANGNVFIGISVYGEADTFSQKNPHKESSAAD